VTSWPIWRLARLFIRAPSSASPNDERHEHPEIDLQSLGLGLELSAARENLGATELVEVVNVGARFQRGLTRPPAR
jgi:hypothetical protein